MIRDRKILLSFDVEEFDLPQEYKQPIPIEEQFETGYKGLVALAEPLRMVPSTLFTTAVFADQFPGKIKELSLMHEIASHSYFHSSFSPVDIKTSKEKLEAIIEKPVYGLRMPRMRQVDVEWVRDAGYRYNSSINPTWIPGRYNNLKSPRSFYFAGSTIQFPVSVTPRLRIPLFWLSFKNMPYSLFFQLARQTLKHDGHLCLYFHPWEFCDLSNYKLPRYVKRGSNKKLTEKLLRLIKDLSGEGEFTTMNCFLNGKFFR
jgi:hypothetical protein